MFLHDLQVQQSRKVPTLLRYDMMEAWVISVGVRRVIQEGTLFLHDLRVLQNQALWTTLHCDTMGVWVISVKALHRVVQDRAVLLQDDQVRRQHPRSTYGAKDHIMALQDHPFHIKCTHKNRG